MLRQRSRHKATTESQRGTLMSQQFMSCPQCSGEYIATNYFQVRCRSCGWSVQDPDPLYHSYVKDRGTSMLDVDEPIVEAIEALPEDFGASLTTTRDALPAGHPANNPSLATAAEFRLRREELGFSAEFLADGLGVALKTVQRWENGHRLVPASVMDVMDEIHNAMCYVAATRCAEQLLKTPDPVMMIPRSGSFLGFPASWYRALVELVRDTLRLEHGEQGLRLSGFPVVYFDDVEEQR